MFKADGNFIRNRMKRLTTIETDNSVFKITRDAIGLHLSVATIKHRINRYKYELKSEKTQLAKQAI